MDFLKDDISLLYHKLLAPSLIGAIVMSIYSFVDTIAVGQSEGVPGTGSMAVIAPIYGLIVFLSILCGIGGSVMMSIARGEGNEEKGNACFTVACLLMAVITAVAWIALLLFKEQTFRLFGANDDVLPKTIEYGSLIIWFLPVFVFTIFIPAFIRNDGAPKLVMAAVIVGGCMNMFGDWFLVFPMKMGMTGAALATVIGTIVQAIIMGCYFFRADCRLKLIKPRHYSKGIRKIFQIGIGASALDLGTIVISAVVNNQILRYGGTTELAVYGVIATIMSLLQALFGGVGQAIQPLVSTNYGANQSERIRIVWKYSFITVIIMGAVFMTLGELIPAQITRVFMDANNEVLAVVPRAFRLHFLVYPFLGVTVLAAYYLQSVMREKASILVGFAHSIILSSAMCFLLPLLTGMDGVWLALPATEVLIAITAFFYIKRVNRLL
ncbi:MAG: hypothetical protein IJV40_05670 [Oscillospiraceae bacterium]|nr:hypothetical protein [Oscillospiraceae bacterium]